MMRVALVNPFPNIDRRQVRINGKIPPLGLLYIAGNLKKHGHEVILVDANVGEYTPEETSNIVCALKPDVISISTNTPNYSLVKQLAHLIRKKIDTPIVIGGHHPTALPEACLKTGLFDYVVIGEGELSFTTLVNNLNNRQYIRDIGGIGFIDNSQMIVNKPQVIEDINILSPKAWDLIDLKQYCPSPGSYIRRPAISTILSRGCHKNCIYCCVNSVFQGVVRLHSIDIIASELELLRSRGIRDVNFWDSIFTYDYDWVREVCRVTRKLGLKWNCNARVDMVDEEILHLMAKSGCYEIGYGIEAGSERSLRLMNKETTFRRALDAIRLSRKAGIMVKCYFMLGFPWETEEDIEQTLILAGKIGPDFATFSITSPYPGCNLFEKVRDRLAEDDFAGISHLSGKYSVCEHFSGEELTRMVSRAYRGFYLRPRYIWNSVKRIRSLNEIKRSLEAAKDIFYTPSPNK